MQTTTPLDWLTLVFAITATGAAIIAALWMWTDKPRYLWWYLGTKASAQQQRRGGGDDKPCAVDPNEEYQQTLTVRNIGSLPMYDARLRVHGARIVGDDDDPMLGSPVLTVSSDPLSVEVLVPARDVPSYLELIWIRPRPLTQHGNRLNLRTLEQEVWRWSWRSLRLRRRPGSIRHLRLTRTRGRWMPLTRGTLATIPEPES